MSTRCQIEFYDKLDSDAQGLTGEYGDPAARIYKHSDGYPSGILPMLKRLQKRLSGKDTGLKKFPHQHGFLGPKGEKQTAWDHAEPA